ncbi:MAG TPA: transposase family protein [Candidatus Acidoferrum sp.]|nr:transposase family protein [Candidatus Acidoferrum sp.]
MGFRETTQLDSMADAARDWQEARLADAGRAGQTLTSEDYADMADEARDWWYGLCDEARACFEAISPGMSIAVQRGQTDQLFSIHVNKLFYKLSCELNGFLDQFFDQFEAELKERFGIDVKQLDLKAAVDGRCELTSREVAMMRIRRICQGTNMRELAKMYDVSVSTVWNILHDRYWKQ